MSQHPTPIQVITPERERAVRKNTESKQKWPRKTQSSDMHQGFPHHPISRALRSLPNHQSAVQGHHQHHSSHTVLIHFYHVSKLSQHSLINSIRQHRFYSSS